MNTRQKLTLGIAAIFMVTLTIVGVTYAFFVTRVKTTNGPTTADVEMAKLASVEYAEGNGLITMDNVIPSDVEYKTFKVLNNNTNQSQYSIILASAKPTDAVSFVHTSAANVTDVSVIPLASLANVFPVHGATINKSRSSLGPIGSASFIL